jgi:hypothetical protein
VAYAATNTPRTSSWPQVVHSKVKRSRTELSGSIRISTRQRGQSIRGSTADGVSVAISIEVIGRPPIAGADAIVSHNGGF